MIRHIEFSLVNLLFTMVFLNDIGTFTQFGRFPIIDNLQLAWPPYGTFYT